MYNFCDNLKWAFIKRVHIICGSISNAATFGAKKNDPPHIRSVTLRAAYQHKKRHSTRRPYESREMLNGRKRGACHDFPLPINSLRLSIPRLLVTAGSNPLPIQTIVSFAYKLLSPSVQATCVESAFSIEWHTFRSTAVRCVVTLSFTKSFCIISNKNKLKVTKASTGKLTSIFKCSIH